VILLKKCEIVKEVFEGQAHPRNKMSLLLCFLVSIN
jgi:hypothetical protein